MDTNNDLPTYEELLESVGDFMALQDKLEETKDDQSQEEN